MSHETRDKIAAAHLGRAKDASWRAKIAIVKQQQQRLRRQEALEDRPSRLPKLKPPVRARQRSSPGLSDGSLRTPSQRPAPPMQLSKDDIREYQRDLKTYRMLRDSLQAWSDAFMEQHGRRPDGNDISATHIPWLIDSFNQYNQMKRKLQLLTSGLRGALATTARGELPRPLVRRTDDITPLE